MATLLVRNIPFLVDDDVFEWASKFKWEARIQKGYLYACRSIRKSDDIGNTTERLHRRIMGCHVGDGRLVDHINGDTKDCRRENLRLVSHGQNARNMRARLHGTSQFKGVALIDGKWRARAILDGTRYHLGYFDDEREAALAYDGAARPFHGKYGCYNFPLPGERSALAPTG